MLIIALVVTAWRQWRKSGRRDRKFAPWLPSVLLAFVCLQGAFGAWTVTMKLQPVIVTIHLLLGLGLLALLTWLGGRQNDPLAQRAPAPELAHRPPRWAWLLLTIQIALGGWVSTNYAALACTDFPLCHGMLVPQMDFAQRLHRCGANWARPRLANTCRFRR